MTKELLAIHEAKCKAKKKAKQVVEGKDDEELEFWEIVEKYLDANHMTHWEGSRGISNFDKLIAVLGYRNMDAFLSDNSGCLEEMVEWIKNSGNSSKHWKDKMKAEVEENAPAKHE